MKKPNAIVLLIDSNVGVRNAINFMLCSDYNFTVLDIDAANFDYSIKALRTKDVQLVITEHSKDLPGLTLLNHLGEKSIPFVCTSGDHPDVRAATNVLKVNREEALVELKKIVDDKFEIDYEAATDEFTAVPFKTLVTFPKIASHVYIQLASGRRLKIYNQGDRIEAADVEKYAQKGVDKLWIERNAYLWVLKNLQDNFEQIVTDEDFTFDDSDFEINIDDFAVDNELEAAKQDVDLNNDPLGDIDLKSFETKTPKNVRPIDTKNMSMDDLDRQLAELDAGFQDNPFTKEQEFLKEVNSKVQNVLKKISKNKNMATLFRQLHINREEGSYIKTRINLVVHLSTTIAKELQWASPVTYEKLIYVAHVHDIALFDRPHLAKAQRIIDLDILKGIKEEDKQHFIPHVEKAVTLVKNDPWAPEGADKIIEQHHERPDKGGFPHQLTHQRIVPFAALLAISIDCAQYMIDTPNWDLNKWIEKNEKKWKGGSYTKVIGGLKKIASQIS